MAGWAGRLVVAGASLLVLVTACASDAPSSDATPAPPVDTPVDTTGDPAPASTPVPPAEPPATEALAPLPPATEPPTTAVPPTTDPDRCPLGAWSITAEELQRYYDTVNAAAGTDFAFAGRVIFTLNADGTFAYSMPDFVLTQSFGGLATSVTLLGDIVGTFRIVDGTFEMEDVNADGVAILGSGVDASYSATVLRGMVTDFPVDHAAFTCEGADLVVVLPVVTDTATVRMVPA